MSARRGLPVVVVVVVVVVEDAGAVSGAVGAGVEAKWPVDCVSDRLGGSTSGAGGTLLVGIIGSDSLESSWSSLTSVNFELF